MNDSRDVECVKQSLRYLTPDRPYISPGRGTFVMTRVSGSSLQGIGNIKVKTKQSTKWTLYTWCISLARRGHLKPDACSSSTNDQGEMPVAGE
jgi:hypothetical protein